MTDTKESFVKEICTFDSSMLPHCRPKLEQHLRRSRYVSSTWNNATHAAPTNLEPSSIVWYKQNNMLSFNWFEGEQVPAAVDEIHTWHSR
ncbi:unnamed protein product [Arctia plantaginis]|uniref:Uncharacterized protein n=1 Tax=Arctia plantaginis TaxID=874455 RepID=A0A8S0YZT8_ARCPL|nr:unnamed protein product [Arctia plantaginis]